MRRSELARRIAWHLRTDAEFRALGWPPGRFLRLYYCGRLRDRLRPGARPLVRRLALRHGISGRPAGVHVRLSPGVGDWIVLRGVWVHQDYFHPGLTRCRTILDVGANIGLAAVWLKGLAPEAAVACVEPDPRNAPLARLNLAANAVAAPVLPYAVAPHAGRARLGLAADTGLSALEGVGPNAGAHRRFVEVETRRIADVLDALGWARVDLLKLDVEGLEPDLFADGRDWLPRVERIVFELHAPTAAETVAGLLRPHGFVLERLGRRAEETFLARAEGAGDRSVPRAAP